MKSLEGRRVAILTENGFEESELTSPMQALKDAGAEVHIVSPRRGKVRGWKDGNWSIDVKVDVHISDADPDEYDALVLPGGVINPDLLRRDMECVSFAKEFLQEGKPVAAICHGPQLLIETGVLNGREVTSLSAIKTDLINAGARWYDKAVVVNAGLVTSRTPEDLEAFNEKMIEEIAEGIHESAD
jgi:protease I